MNDDRTVDELVEQFLDKWVFDAGMNGGDTRHVRNDLERLIETVRRDEGDLCQSPVTCGHTYG